MDMSSGEWLTDLGNEDAANIIRHCQMMLNSNANLDEFDNLLLSQQQQQPTDLFFNNESNDIALITSLETNKPLKHGVVKEMKSENDINWSSYTSSNNSCERIISFGSSEIDSKKSIKGEDDLGNFESGITSNNALIKSTHNNNTIHNKWNNNGKVGSTSLCSQEHVLAERRRREKMTERFVALSALIPGLKKMDKASILGDAAKYVKQLEEQIRKQEEQVAKRRVESVVLVKKSHGEVDCTSSSSDETLTPGLVDIEARISNKNVLIRVHSQKKDGLLEFVLKEIGNLHMTILNCTTMPFGRYAVDITLIAEIIDDNNLSMTSNEIVKHLGLALQQFTSLGK
ncbi:transcription factor bHLH18-like [Silene latifolia]|uniref:transcription factor bHLH18-like n=1 Tax=Silene latifolia TaxID=37657 RepID=UPI003D787A81